MKKHISFLAFIFSISLFFTACPLWCDLGEDAVLENTEATITPDKETYSVGETVQLSVSSIADFSKYGKYLIQIELWEFDKETNYYKLATNFVISEDGKEIKESEISCEYKKDDVKDTVLEKNLSVQFLTSTEFRFYVYVTAFEYHEGGGFSGISYNKCLKIHVLE